MSQVHRVRDELSDDELTGAAARSHGSRASSALRRDESAALVNPSRRSSLQGVLMSSVVVSPPSSSVDPLPVLPGLIDESQSVESAQRQAQLEAAAIPIIRVAHSTQAYQYDNEAQPAPAHASSNPPMTDHSLDSSHSFPSPPPSSSPIVASAQPPSDSAAYSSVDEPRPRRRHRVESQGSAVLHARDSSSSESSHDSAPLPGAVNDDEQHKRHTSPSNSKRKSKSIKTHSPSSSRRVSRPSSASAAPPPFPVLLGGVDSPLPVDSSQPHQQPHQPEQTVQIQHQSLPTHSHSLSSSHDSVPVSASTVPLGVSSPPRSDRPRPVLKQLEPIELPHQPDNQFKTFENEKDELERIKREKDFSSEFADLLVPPMSLPPSASSANPVHSSWLEVRALLATAESSVETSQLPLDGDSVQIGHITLEEYDHIEHEMEAMRIHAKQSDLYAQFRKQQELVLFQSYLSKTLSWQEHAYREDIQKREYTLLTEQRLLIKQEQEHFRKVEDQMRTKLLAKQGVLHVEQVDISSFGKKKNEKEGEEKLSDAAQLEKVNNELRAEIEDLYATVRSRHYQVSCLSDPRLVRVRIDWLRAAKNKLLSGSYKLMVTLYDRLGGQPLRWTSNNAQYTHTGATQQAQKHEGNFYNLDLQFNQRFNHIFLACPPKLHSKPSMIFLFELFLCGDSDRQQQELPKLTTAQIIVELQRQQRHEHDKNPHTHKYSKITQKQIDEYQQKAQQLALQQSPPTDDKPVAWGAFPMSYLNFEIVQGRFKIPLLRGGYKDEHIEKFDSIHRKIVTNLDNWLCNLYFDVKHWNRFLDSYSEQKVELNFINSQSKPEGASSSSDAPSSDAPHNPNVRTQETEEKIEVDPEIIRENEQKEREEKERQEKEKQENIPAKARKRHHKHSAASSSPSSDGAAASTAASSPSSPLLGDVDGSSDAEHAPHEDVADLQSTHHIDMQVDTRVNDALEARKKQMVQSEREMEVILKTIRYPGFFRDLPDLTEQQQNELRNMKKRHDLLKTYEYSLNHSNKQEEGSNSDTNPLGKKAGYKLRYIMSELDDDIGISKPRHALFALLLFFTMWVRIFTHYLGQYLYLSNVHVAIQSWTCNVYTCYIEYVEDPSSITAQIQVGVVSIGLITNLCFFLVFMLCMFGFQRSLGRAPTLLSRAMLAWGIGTVIEAVQIIIIDCADSKWEGDAFKLYQYYYNKDGNGLAGLFMTILIDLFLFFLSLIALYTYLLYLHHNGRILDVHYRLHGVESQFYTPQDLEISVRELQWIVEKARRWIGMDGSKRKIQVTKFTQQDPLRPNYSSPPCIHIAIYTQALNGEIELYRHFLRDSDGMVCELFDSFESTLSQEEQFAKIEEKLVRHERLKQKSVEHKPISVISTPFVLDADAQQQHAGSLLPFNRLMPTKTFNYTAGSMANLFRDEIEMGKRTRMGNEKGKLGNVDRDSRE